MLNGAMKARIFHQILLIIDIFALGFLTIKLQASLSANTQITSKLTLLPSAQVYLTRWGYVAIYGWLCFALNLAYWLSIAVTRVLRHREEKQDEAAYL